MAIKKDGEVGKIQEQIERIETFALNGNDYMDDPIITIQGTVANEH